MPSNELTKGTKSKRSKALVVRRRDRDDFSRGHKTGTTPLLRVSNEGNMVLSVPKTPSTPNDESKSLVVSSNILEEDEYMNKLEAIIERDFFPEIKNMQRKMDMIDYVIKHGELPVFEHTPTSTSLPSLSSFQNDNISEDDASFKQLMEKNRKHLQARYPWIWNPETVKAITNGKMESSRTVSAPQQVIELIARMTPQIEHENKIRAERLGWVDRRQTNLKTWKSGEPALNTFMFNADRHGIGLTDKQLESQESKVIQHSQTRFQNSSNDQNNKDASITKNADPLKVDGYSYILPEPSPRENLRDKLLNKNLTLRQQEKFGNLPTKFLSPDGRSSRRSKQTIPLSPAGSHLLASLSARKSSTRSGRKLHKVKKV